MAGSRQHFLPRFLMKGFSSKIQKGEYYTWVFTRDSKPYETNLKNIGLENFFYGSAEESEVDEVITQKENYYYGHLDNLRENNSDCNLSDPFPAEFITHLIVRAKHLRESFKNAGATIVSIAHEELDSPQKFAQMLQNIIINQPELVMQSLGEELDKKLPPGFPSKHRDQLVKHALTLIPQIVFSDSNINDGYTLFRGLFKKMVEDMHSLAKCAHIKALSKDVVPPKILEKFDGFIWSLHVAHRNSFVLGDIGPLARFEPDLDFKSFLFANDEINQVFLPISDRHVIVGKSDADSHIPSVHELNKASAFLSQYYFISSSCGKGEEGLSEIISSNSSNITDKDISDTQAKIRKDWFGISND